MNATNTMLTLFYIWADNFKVERTESHSKLTHCANIAPIPKNLYPKILNNNFPVKSQYVYQ